MGSDYGIDSHKLMYHVERVARWRQGEDIYPIYIEVAPAGGCNQRCIFCGLDYLQHTPNFLSLACWNRFIPHAAKRGVKSVLFSGEGEPLLNKDISAFIEITKTYGIDAALASNAVFLSRVFIKKSLRHLTWLRVSLDAAQPKTYAKVHGVDSSQFTQVIANIREAVNIKKRKGYAVTIGIQFLLLPENIKEVEAALKIAIDLGVDYFSIKPYSKHPLSVNNAGEGIDYSRCLRLEKKVAKYNSDSFSVIFRKETMKRGLSEKKYAQCLGLPFWAYISSFGDVYPCSTFLGLQKYCIGNICRQSFSSIWRSERRAKVMDKLIKMDARQCRESCRLDAINTYLWKLVNPPRHVNFI